MMTANPAIRAAPNQHIIIITPEMNGSPVDSVTVPVRLALAAPALLAACEAWAKFADELENNGDPSDPIVAIRARVHGARIAQTRAAIALAK